ncbi:protein YnjB [Roseibium sp. TrichSKD4]|uniref:ABC transporter substrate-binding protein n=1 Tax=Roseibium sp. TrichSKD4 TaxID=744980 RepID=UPI0001E56334|nr:ABC transporter substrate-binding protein [Roseibium sp. TrichSKD4]EFO33115.1 protein YnjB [Roseibium sp. TrichSKD4]
MRPTSLKSLLASAALCFSFATSLGSANADAWTDDTLDAARGQTVYFHAWGGEQRINAYIDWAAKEIEQRYGVTVEHVKVSETGAVVSQVVGEKTAGRDKGGSVDLVWINGENFATLKSQGLLSAPGWAQSLPNWKYVDAEGKPTVLNDFTVPTDGQESPWGMAQLVFMYDTRVLSEPPRSLEALAALTERQPGRFTYPQPPSFYGTTFLKQALINLIVDPDKLSKPVNADTFEAETRPLFAYLDELHKNLWRGGEVFPKNAAQLRLLLADGELDVAFSFNPSDASAAIANNELPNTIRTFVFDGGTIGNTHFLAIPYNSSAKEGAMVLANFLLSPEAQARKQDPTYWGDPTVLNLKSLDADDRAAFDRLDLGIATLTPEQLGNTLPEPHPSWVTALEKAWVERYGGN